MTQEEPNPLDPELGLTYEVSQLDGENVLTYYLTIAVPRECLDGDSQQLITDPVAVAAIAEMAKFTVVEGEINDVVLLSVFKSNACIEPNVKTVIIRNNPNGKPGTIAVLVSPPPPPTSNYSHSPQSDGKSIIRFEKAVRAQSPVLSE